MIAWLLLHVLSAIVLASVCYRLFVLPLSEPSLRCRLRWHAGVMAYVLIGLGMCARLLQLPQWAALLTTAGLALYFGARWHRRSGDR
jgi:hypothetical protein